MQVRITDQAPHQKREGEIWAWRGVWGGRPGGPPQRYLKEPARLRHYNRVFAPFHYHPLPFESRPKQGSFGSCGGGEAGGGS